MYPSGKALFRALTNISFIAGTLRSSSSVIKPSEECLANSASIAATSDAAGNSVALAVEDRTLPSFANQGGDRDRSLIANGASGVAPRS